MKHVFLVLIGISTSILFHSCKETNMISQTDLQDNPFINEFDTPYGVPPFDKIKDAHYKPALEAAMEAHKREIDAIAENKNEADFVNTIEALDTAGSFLNRVSYVFYNLTGANTNEVLQALEQEMAPKLAKHYDYISLYEKLFARVKSVYDKRENLELSEEQNKLLEDTYKSFVRNGALLTGKDRERISSINEQLSGLTVKFSQNVLAEVNSYQMLIDNEEDLAGLPSNLVSTAAESAAAAGHDGKWLFTLQNPSVMPFLQYADNRELRKTIWEAFKNKCKNGNEYDNREIIRDIVNLRLEKAKLLGYATHADYVLEERMAKKSENVQNLLDQLWPAALQKAKAEEAEINEYIRKQGGDFACEAFDWRYYAEKIRVEKYDLNENELKEYFQLENMHKAVFGTVEKLWGLQFKERKDLPSYHPEATAYEVTEADGSTVGILYMDFHPRESKRSGAWMSSFSPQKMKSGERILPVIMIVCNFTKATGDIPALLTFDEVTTYYHEFGHALHGLLSNTQYNSQAGTNVPTDFVELPSMIMENWASEAEVLKMFATHYKTGETIPDQLVNKMKNAGTYGQGFATVEYLSSTILDMDYHTITEKWIGDPVIFENEKMEQAGLISSIIPRHSSTYFLHLFTYGYSAGYYSYIWSEVLDADAFEVFKKNGIFDQETATSFRKNILERGGSADAMELYIRFRGQEPIIQPLLKKRGLM
jgi:peptidyl-dipeptidase Dcp